MVKRRYLARFGIGFLVGRNRVEQLDDARVGIFDQLGAGAPARTVGRDLGLGHPVAVDVGEKVVARQHRHRRRLGGARRCCRLCRLAGSEGGIESERCAANGKAEGGLDRCPACLHVIPFLA
jgi:hypothetical protein